MSNGSNVSQLYEMLKRFLRLNIENARLSVAERMTLLFAGITFYMILILLGICVIGFLSVSFAQLLSEALSEFWAYMIIAGVYLIFILIVVALRKPLIVDPIARFVSQIIVESPEK